MLVVVNAGSGILRDPAQRERLRTLLHDAGLQATIVELQAMVDDGSETVVAAGGDGTVNAVAARLVGSERTLGVIPGGTLNHFARDLGIPQDLEGAVALLQAGTVRRVDVAEVNGRIFLNNSSIGLYPEIVREREKIRRRGFRKWTAFAAAIVATLIHWPLIRVWLDVGDRHVKRLTPFVFVGNNRYELEGLRMGSRRRLDGGELCLCVARRMSRFSLALMAVRGLLGGLRNSGDLGVVCTREASVEPRRPVAVALDGEVTRLDPPLRYTIRPGALRVIAP